MESRDDMCRMLRFLGKNGRSPQLSFFPPCSGALTGNASFPGHKSLYLGVPAPLGWLSVKVWRSVTDDNWLMIPSVRFPWILSLGHVLGQQLSNTSSISTPKLI